MIQTTFQTLKKHPELIFGVLITGLIGGIILTPAFLGMDTYFENFFKMQSGDAEAIHAVVNTGALMFFLSLLSNIVVGFLLMPALMNRTYEACAGIAEPGWLGRGIKRCWWKPFVTGLIISASATVIVLVTAIISIIPILGGLVSFAIYIGIGVFTIIAYTSTIAEDNYGEGLGGIFTTGSKYFFKLLGILALVMIVPVIIMSIFSGIFMSNMMEGYNTGQVNDPVMMFSSMFQFMKPMIIISLVMSIYYVIAYPFVYTYSMHQYISEKGIYVPSQPVQQPAASSDYVIQSRDMTL